MRDALSLQIESVNDKAGIVYSGMGPDYRCVCVCMCVCMCVYMGVVSQPVCTLSCI